MYLFYALECVCKEKKRRGGLVLVIVNRPFCFALVIKIIYDI